MSETDSDFDISSENTRLMDGHVEANGNPEVRNVNENTRKRRPRNPNERNYPNVKKNVSFFNFTNFFLQIFR